MTKHLATLEKRRLIKSFKPVARKVTKHWLLYELEPPEWM